MQTPQIDADVLVVDDEPGICKGIQRVLTACGARVEIASNGREAMGRLSAGEYDVAVIDLVMPSFGGMEVLEQMTAAGIEAAPIVITAHVSIETAIEAMRRGAFDYLPKPFVPLELVVRVERALHWRRLRQEAERRLLELNTDRTQLRTIVNSLADGIIIVNVENDVVMCNPAARAALGAPTVEGAPCPLDSCVTQPELLELMARVRDAAAADPQARTSYSGRLEIADRVYMARVVPIVTQKSELLGTATVIRDVTELTTLERAKSQFMSMVAHELKAPLAAVQGFLKVILTEQELAPEKQREVLARCSDRVEGMAQLVRDLLELSRADAVPLRRTEPLALEEIVAEVLAANELFAQRGGVSLHAAVAPDCPPFHADRDDIIRLLTNLVSNAIKYNKPGGEVTVSVRYQGDRICLEVADTGLGIPAEGIPRLGEEFYRIGTPDRRGIIGTGLGLSLVRRVVEAYHGRMEVRSTVGEGTVFTVWLPCAFPSDASRTQ